MRLLASTDIALRILMLLGQRQPGQVLNVADMAAALGGLSRNHLHKIVQDLAALGLIRTARGAGGGVSLARPLSEVSVGFVVRALERDQALVECFRADRGNCVLDRACRLRGMLRAAEEAFYQSLDAQPLSDCTFLPAPIPAGA